MKLHLGGNTPHEKILPPYIWKTQNQCHMTTLNTWIGWTPHKVLVSPSRQEKLAAGCHQDARHNMHISAKLCPGRKVCFRWIMDLLSLVVLERNNLKKNKTGHLSHGPQSLSRASSYFGKPSVFHQLGQNLVKGPLTSLQFIPRPIKSFHSRTINPCCIFIYSPFLQISSTKKRLG